MKRAVATLALLAMVMMPASAFSQRAVERGVYSYDYDTCLHRAADKLSLNQHITVMQRNGDSTAGIAGVLESIDPAHGTLLLRTMEDDQSRTLSFSNDQVDAIQYRARGEVQGSWTAIGLIGGAVIGGLAGAIAGHEEFEGDLLSPDTDQEVIYGGIVIGAVGGAILGIVLSPFFPSTQTVVCDEAEPQEN